MRISVDNIQICFTQMRQDNVDWIQLAQKMNQRRNVVKTIVNLLVSEMRLIPRLPKQLLAPTVS